MIFQGDGTYDTTSRLSFWTTRWDNDRTFSCESRQLAVPLEQDGNILNRSHVLDVQCTYSFLCENETETNFKC